MADRLVAPPNTEEDEEFLTDVDKSPPVSREDDYMPMKRRIQEGLRGCGSEDKDANEKWRKGALEY
jgi:hypothetical protein